MKPTPRHVLALWRRDPAWQASLKDIRLALGGKAVPSSSLKSLLDELVAQGKLAHGRRGFRLAASAQVNSAQAPPPRRRAREHSNELRGRFSAHPDGYGFVDVEGRQASLFVPPRHIGGALDGDLVQARTETSRRDGRLSGTITAVLERGRRRVRGFIHMERGDAWIVPPSEKLPMVFVEPEQDNAPCSAGDFVEAQFVSYPSDAHTAPSARVLRVLEEPEAPERVVEHILADLRIETDFSGRTGREMAALARTSAPFTAAGREDLTARPFVTIDGADARDFDDAVCLERTSQGKQLLLVAIADVAEFVLPDSAVDDDAYARGTSVYFPERVVPMLPEALSNDLCSLKPNLPRLTLVCEMELDSQGKRSAYRIYEALIRSSARLTYEQVQRYFDTGKPAALRKASPLAPMLTDMLALSEALAAKRKARGALAFEFPEARFELGGPGKPANILRVFPTQATRLIEQFMLEANETVAWHCERKGIPILYRVHDSPPPDQLAELRLLLHNFGITARERDLAEGPGINRLLAEIADHPQRAAIELAVLRSMSQAQYRAANDGHFGLHATHYAHFTSPIRRYPDLLVHRALKQTLARGKRAGKKPAPPGDAGGFLSERERRAGEAEGRVNRLYRVLYMERFLGEEFAATVTGLSSKALWLSLQAHFVEGPLPVALLSEDHYRLDARRQVLTGARTRRVIGLGQRLTVRLARADRLTQELEFALVAWDRKEGEAPSLPKPRKARRGKRR